MTTNERSDHPGIGIHENVPSATYHGWRLASASQLKVLDRATPADLRESMLHPKDTPQMRLGSAFHALVLEPDRFPELFAWDSPVNEKTGEPYGAATKAFAEWAAGQGGRTVITRAQYETAGRMAEAVLAKSTMRGLLRLCPQREVSCIAEMHGSTVKSRFDALGHGIAFDLKSSGQGAGRVAFERAIATFGYDLQAAFYLNVAAAVDRYVSDFVFVAVDPRPPHNCGFYRLKNEVIDAVEQKLPVLLERYRTCVGLGEWPGLPDEVVDIGIPKWSMKELLEQVEGAGYE